MCDSTTKLLRTTKTNYPIAIFDDYFVTAVINLSATIFFT